MMAIKATYCEVEELVDYVYPKGNETNSGNGLPEYKIIGREIFKDPITDDGTKKSAKGLLAVFKDKNGELYLKDQASWKEVLTCEFKTVLYNGAMVNRHTLSEIRKRVQSESVY